eukprot:Phypoly_transcript_08447.p1 GENE.Phypoly_transcript_08447~~Phypoly_transcript_08447.p1  ORF type:complete len:463 (+),score=102.35 Phypoly_transcript_08447:92-1480(+)
MKRKTSSSSTPSLFADQVFVISKTNTNKKQLETKVLSLGGKVVDKITKNITYFVQDYHVDDDGRLAAVKKHQGKVVSPVFIDRCESENRILGFHEYAIGLPTYEESKNKKAKTQQKPNNEKKTNNNSTKTNNKKEKGEADEKEKDKNDKKQEKAERYEKAFKIPDGIFNDLFFPIRESDREDEEFPQTYDNFLEMPDKNAPTKTKKYIYILPLGYEPTEAKEKGGKGKDKEKGEKEKGERKGKKEYKGIDLDVVEEFLQVFFGMPTKLLPSWKFKQAKNKIQIMAGNKNYPISTDKDGRLQVMDILEAMWDHIPKDACCVIGITLHDIFEIEEDENQFWGRATGDGCAVISLNRFNPDLFEGGKKEDNFVLSLTRSLNTIVHETMHIFGIDHCVFYRCNMNSSEPILTNIDETLPLCPIDLRKLHHIFKFDVLQRYHNLHEFYKKYKFRYEANWVSKRISTL